MLASSVVTEPFKQNWMSQAVLELFHTGSFYDILKPFCYSDRQSVCQCSTGHRPLSSSRTASLEFRYRAQGIVYRTLYIAARSKLAKRHTTHLNRWACNVAIASCSRTLVSKHCNLLLSASFSNCARPMSTGENITCLFVVYCTTLSVVYII